MSLGLDSRGELAFTPDYTEWLDSHEDIVQRYLFTCIREYSRDFVKDEFYAYPQMGYKVVEDFRINMEDRMENVNKLLDFIRTVDCLGVNFRGARRSGKTTTAFALAEFLKDEYDIVVVAPYIDTEVLPDWISWVPAIKYLRKGNLAIVDENAMLYGNRQSMRGDTVRDMAWLAIAAHTGAKLFTITQLASITDINILRFTNVDICKSYDASAYSEDVIERKEIVDDISKYLKPRADYIIEGSSEKSWSLVTRGPDKYTIYLEKPDYVTDAMSRSYMQFIEKANGDPKRSEKIALEALKLMIDNDVHASMIYSQMTSRGFDISLGQIYHLIERFGKVKEEELENRMISFFEDRTEEPQQKKTKVTGTKLKELLPGLASA